MYPRTSRESTRLRSAYFITLLAAALAAPLAAPRAAAQSLCPPPGTIHSYDTTGLVSDESGSPLEGVRVYSSSGPELPPLATTGPDGSWRSTISICTLSPPRCYTNWNNRSVPVKQGYFFTPTSGEICPLFPANFVATPAPFISASAASYATAIAPGSLAVAFASDRVALASGIESATGLPLPESLAGTTVSITGFIGPGSSPRPARLSYASPGQVNYYLPPETLLGAAEVVVRTAEGLTLRSSAVITRIAPAVFSADGNGQGVASAVVQRLKPDGSVSYEPVAVYDPVAKRYEAAPIDLGPDGDRAFLALFGTGIRNRTALGEVKAKVGGEEAEVLYAGPQNEFAGLDQVNLLLPRGLAGRGEVDVELTIEGQATNKVKVRIR